MRVAVVGIGGTGSAAARFLAQAGHTVVGFEQFEIGHVWGSSHGESRIIRYTYADAVYTCMMGEAYPLWRELERDAGAELLVRTGGLFFGAWDSPVVASAQAALDGSQVPYERLDAEQSRRRFPALRLADTEAALFQPDMGYLRATDCVRANARLARALGADLREQTPVRQVSRLGDRAVVTTEAGAAEEFDRAIVTAGPWMGSLLAALHLPLRVTRQQVVYLQPEAGAEPDFAADRLPVWIDADANVYGFPVRRPHRGRQAGRTRAGRGRRPGRPAPPAGRGLPASDGGLRGSAVHGPDRSGHARTGLPLHKHPGRGFSDWSGTRRTAYLAGQRLLRARVQVHRPARQNRRRGRDSGRRAPLPLALCFVPLRRMSFAALDLGRCGGLYFGVTDALVVEWQTQRT